MISETQSDRFLRIGNALNFRHLGLYETNQGRRTREDLLFRSGWFELSSARDFALFEQLGIRRIFDFRTETERQRKPLQIDSVPDVDHVPLDISNGSMAPYLQAVQQMNPSDIDCRTAMTEMYRAILDEAAPKLRQLLRILSDAEGASLLLCSTGKDRTGVASAVLLYALGVGKASIVQDYLLSAEAYAGHELQFARNHGLESLGHDVEVFRDIFTVHFEYLEAAWKSTEVLHGGMAGYLHRNLHVDRGMLDQLKSRYTRAN